VAVVAIAAYMDLSGPPGEMYPFAAETAVPGEPVLVEWREIPRGVLPPYGSISGVAGRTLAAGTPLVSGLLEPTTAVPDDWWAVAVELPPAARAGSDVMITTRVPALEVIGIVVTPPTSNGFGSLSPGLMALPPDHAATVANALAEGRATVLVRP
jgi:hypothetical protein